MGSKEVFFFCFSVEFLLLWYMSHALFAFTFYVFSYVKFCLQIWSKMILPIVANLDEFLPFNVVSSSIEALSFRMRLSFRRRWIQFWKFKFGPCWENFILLGRSCFVVLGFFWLGLHVFNFNMLWLLVVQILIWLSSFISSIWFLYYLGLASHREDIEH